MYYDTHAHLNARDFLNNYDQIIKEAHDAGVTLMNVVGFDPETNKLAQEIAGKYENIYAACGLHPSDVDRFTDEFLSELEVYLQEPKTVAVGECGLDYYWHKENKERQRYFFEAQIALAFQYHKPLIIHVRDALQDAYDLLEKAAAKHPIEGVMHCYSGSPEMAQRFMKLGLYISLGGPVTFKNAKEPKLVATEIPLERLLIETDSPYLAPHPYRGKQNRPALVVLVAEEIARLRKLTPEAVGKATAENAKRLFGIKDKQELSNRSKNAGY